MSVDRPERPPLTDSKATFLVEEDEVWSGERLLGLAARIAQAAPEGPVVGVCSPNASFVAASALALWKLGREPLIFDPNLKSEPEAVLARYPGMGVLTDMSYPVIRDSIFVNEGAAPAFEPAWPAPEQTAALFFTSGSAGEPKLVPKRGRQLFRQMDAELAWLGVPTELRVNCLAPPFHILGFVYGIFLPLLGRGCTSFSPRALAAQWVASLNEQRPNLVVGVPYQFRTLASHTKAPLPPAFYFTTGAPLTPDIDALFRERTGQSLTQGYGATETGGIAKRTGYGPWQPFPKLEWKVAEDGRLTVRSPWQENPDAWHVADDVVAAEGEGFVLLGRADSIVKVGGKRFSTDEVAAAAQGVPGVTESASLAYERFGQPAVALFVVAGPEVTPASLRTALGAKLAPFKVPRTIEVVAQLPRLSSGKIDRQQLRKLVEVVS